MLRSIIRSSLQFRIAVVIVAVVAMVAGTMQLRNMPVDVLPEFSQPYVEIQTEALGLSADEVEQLITTPLEQDLLNGVPWLESIHSQSVNGLSSIVLVFEPGTNLYRARQMVSERMTQAFALPHVSKPPTMIEPESSTSRFLIVGLSSKTLSLIDMSVLARWTIAPRLMGVPGVSNVAIWGQRDRQLQVQVDPKLMQDHKVSLLQVLETTGNALWVSSLSFVEASTPGSGGFIDTAQQRLGIRHISPIVTADSLAEVPVEDAPGVSIGDVAKVVEDHQPLIGDAMTNGGPGLLLVIQKFPGANTLEVTRGVEDALAELQPGMSGLQMDSNVFRPADFIEAAIHNIGVTLLVGFLLVLLFLLAFFLEWRMVLVSLITIPLSLVAAAYVLYLRGATFNIVLLAGLVAALGIIIDDTIVSLESASQRLNRHRKEGSTRSTFSIVLESLMDLRSPIVYSTLILLLAVSGVFFVKGLSSAFFQAMGVSFMLAVLASMLVALIVTPALCLMLLANQKSERRASPLAKWLQRGYESTLARTIQRGRFAFIAILILTVLGAAVLPSLNKGLLPPFKERNLLVHLDAAPGASWPEMTRISNQVSADLQVIPGISNVAVQMGRAVYGDRAVGMNSAELWMTVNPSADYNQTVAAVQKALSVYPGFHYKVDTYLNKVGSEVIPQKNSSLVVRVYGDTDDHLRTAAENVKTEISNVKGVVGSQINYPVQEPGLEIEVNLAKAQAYGIKPGDVRRTAAVMFSGLQVGALFEEQKVFDVMVWSIPETRQGMDNVRNLLIETPDGQYVRLGDVADVRLVSTSSVINHEQVKRYVDVAVSVGGRSVSVVAAEIMSLLKQGQFPLEVHAEVLGGYADQQAAMIGLTIFIGILALATILLLESAFGSWRLAFAVLLTLPMALAGGVLAAFLTHSTLSLGSLAGFVTLLGIALRNNTLLFDRYQQLESQEGKEFSPELILHGSLERLTPILITTLATALVMIPALFMGDVPGLEIIRPMAIVILGGLVTSTLLDLFVLPVLYWRYGVRRERNLDLVPAVELPASASD